jgi:pullulanase/glycogen debranching enzyme
MPHELKQRTNKTIAKGTPYLLGATLTHDGVNFALYFKQTEVFLFLFDKPDSEPTDKRTSLLPQDLQGEVSKETARLQPIRGARSRFQTPKGFALEKSGIS